MSSAPPSFHPLSRNCRRFCSIATVLELEVQVRPRDDEPPPWSSEERADDGERDRDRGQPPEREHCDLAVPNLGSGVPVEVRQEHEQDDRAGWDEDAGDERVEVRQQLLETVEVPRRLRRL